MSAGLEPIHFGPGDRLFGLRAEPTGPARQTAVVICHSWGPEYMRSYRAVFRLAEQLAARGFDTLRFDYSCTGDSQDHDCELSLEHWVEDIGCAVEELRALSGVDQICLLGLRIGALLGARAIAAGVPAQRLALWDAPHSGRSWLDQLSALNHEHYARKNRYRPSWLSLRLPRDELLGAPWPPALARSIAALEVAQPLPPERLLLLSGSDVAPPDWTAAHRIELPEASHWGDIERLNTPWIPPHNLRVVCDALEDWLP